MAFETGCIEQTAYKAIQNDCGAIRRMLIASLNTYCLSIDLTCCKYDNETFGLTDFPGLNLFNGILICHCSESREEDLITLTEQGEQNIIKLRDQDYIFLIYNNAPS